MIVNKYLKNNYPKLSREERHQILDYLLPDIADNDDDITLPETLHKVYDSVMYYLEDNQEENTWENTYYENSNTNKYLIQIIKKSQKKNIKVPGMVLYDIWVPLGKRVVVIGTSNGYYPNLVDE